MVGSRGLRKGPEHRGYFVSASALYDLASASILISTKAGLDHVMANSLVPGRAPISGTGVGRATPPEAGIHQLANNGKPARRPLEGKPRAHYTRPQRQQPTTFCDFPSSSTSTSVPPATSDPHVQ
jgi:hypothetical protein